jgi:hypothetical protein
MFHLTSVTLVYDNGDIYIWNIWLLDKLLPQDEKREMLCWEFLGQTDLGSTQEVFCQIVSDPRQWFWNTDRCKVARWAILLQTCTQLKANRKYPNHLVNPSRMHHDSNFHPLRPIQSHISIRTFFAFLWYSETTECESSDALCLPPHNVDNGKNREEFTRKPLPCFLPLNLSPE